MKKLLMLILLFIFIEFKSFSQNVGIGTNTPHASAVLDISDTAKGILIPRMTMVQRKAIQNPAEGLMVYQTDSTKGFWYSSAGSWFYQGIKKGSINGEMLYWNGISWSPLAPGNNGQYLKWCNGTPTWDICTPVVYTSLDSSNPNDPNIVGNISLDGGSKINKYGFVYGTQPNPSISVSFKTQDSFPTVGGFSKRLLDLDSIYENTTYHFRAYATNSAGTSYGNDIIYNKPAIFRVTPPISNHLYIVGAATLGGWNNPVPIPSQEFTQTSSSTYEISIYLTGGQQYLLLPLNGSWNSKYGASFTCTSGCGGVGTFDFVSEGSDIEGPAISGNYKIVVNFFSGTITVSPI